MQGTEKPLVHVVISQGKVMGCKSSGKRHVTFCKLCELEKKGCVVNGKNGFEMMFHNVETEGERFMRT
ncbi:MAG: hypothetical protein ACLFTS_02680 [Candidatus Paceibacterota bacterium]